MATARKIAEAAQASSAPAQPAESVYLRSEDTGETRAFTPAHAKALLNYQQGKGYTHWQPADAPVTEDGN